MLFSLLSCADAKKAPVGSMTSYSYHYNTSPAYNQNEYSAKLLDDGRCQIGFAHNEQGDTIIVSGEVMKQIETIYREHEIYNYKAKYKPSLEVLDGDMWGYSAHFGEEYFQSSGSNAGPSDRGLKEINDILMKLLHENYIKQYCDHEWEGKIKDNNIHVSFAKTDSVVNVSIQLTNGEGTWLSVAGELESYNDALSSFHGHLKDMLSDTTKPVTTCVDVYVKPGSEEIILALSGNDMAPILEKGIEGVTWEDYRYISMKKTARR